MDSKLKILYKYIGFIILITLSNGIVYCYQAENSPTNKVFRNLGAKINTSYDEFMPNTYRDTLYFRRNNKKNQQNIIRVAINEYLCSSPNLKNFKLIDMQEYSNSDNKIDKSMQAVPSIPVFYNFADSIHSFELPKRLEFGISGNYNDLHPAIAPDGSFLIFASDRPAEAGAERMKHTDLFISYRKKDGSWTEAKSLGKKINTDQNEITPFIASDYTLYFASKGYRKGAAEVYFSAATSDNSDIQIVESKYNYDIIRIKSTVIGGKVKYNDTPEKLSYPFNTEWDDLGAILYNDSLIISSNRPSSPIWGIAHGGFDLYGWTYEECPCSKQCADVNLYGLITGNNLKNHSETKIKIYGMNNDSKQKLLIDTIIGKESKYNYRVAWYNQYFYELSQVCSQVIIKKDTICFAEPCSFDTVKKVRADFVFDNSCQPIPKEECKDCPPRCIDYQLNIELLCSADTLLFPGKIQVFRNNILYDELLVGKIKQHTIRMEQENPNGDSIRIAFQNEGIPANSQIEHNLVHRCNPDTSDMIKIALELPNSCCEDACKFNLSGKLICEESGMGINGELQFIINKNEALYKTFADNNGNFKIDIVQFSDKSNIRIIYKNNSGKVKDFRIKHSCEQGNISNLLLKIPNEICKQCQSSITLNGIIKPDEYLCSLKGMVIITDLKSNKQFRVPVSEDGKFSSILEYAERYKVVYKNNCIAKDLTKYITLKECPNNDISINIQFDIHNKLDNFNLSKEQFPLFVTGYWKLNTKQNLYELYELFDNPQFGKSIACAVADPASEFDTYGNKINYWDYTDRVVRSIFDARNYILDAIQRYECGCQTGSNLDINIICYNNTSEINCESKYNGVDVNDLGIKISNGSIIDGYQLAELRAYDIYQELTKMLEKSKTYQKLRSKINFGILIENAKPNLIANQSFDIKISNDNLTER